jgi:hypothetical protein
VRQPEQQFTAEELAPGSVAGNLAETSAIKDSGRRSEPRYSIDGDSVLFIVGHGLPVPSRIIDLSQEGCRVRTAKPAPVFARSRLPVEIFFKVSGTAFRFRGVIQWMSGNSLLGIRFVNMIPRRVVALAEVLCEIEAAVAIRAEAAKKLAVEHEARAITGPELEPSHSPTERGETAAEDAVAPAAATPSRGERRGSARHELGDSAEIHLVKIGSILRGRILDLSLGGCRIRTEERFHIGIYTRVETEFRLEGLPFRLGGVIQAIHDRNTVGIRFLDLSERKQQQVLNLIEEIAALRAAHNFPEATAAEGLI